MNGLAYWRDVLRTARTLVDAGKRGQAIISVPRAQVAGIKRDSWVDKVETAAKKWETIVSDISLPEWEAAMKRRREEREQ